MFFTTFTHAQNSPNLARFNLAHIFITYFQIHLNIIHQSTLYLPTHLFQQTSPTITSVLFFLHLQFYIHSKGYHRREKLLLGLPRKKIIRERSEFLGTKRRIQKAKICGRTNLILTVKGEKTLFLQEFEVTSILTAMFNLHRCRPTYFTRFFPPPHSEGILPQNQPGFNSARLGKHSSHSTCNMAVVSSSGVKNDKARCTLLLIKCNCFGKTSRK